VRRCPGTPEVKVLQGEGLFYLLVGLFAANSSFSFFFIPKPHVFVPPFQKIRFAQVVRGSRTPKEKKTGSAKSLLYSIYYGPRGKLCHGFYYDYVITFQ
jgi:hypothetical protein